MYNNVNKPVGQSWIERNNTIQILYLYPINLFKYLKMKKIYVFLYINLKYEWILIFFL